MSKTTFWMYGTGVLGVSLHSEISIYSLLVRIVKVKVAII